METKGIEPSFLRCDRSVLPLHHVPISEEIIRLKQQIVNPKSPSLPINKKLDFHKLFALYEINDLETLDFSFLATLGYYWFCLYIQFDSCYHIPIEGYLRILRTTEYKSEMPKDSFSWGECFSLCQECLKKVFCSKLCLQGWLYPADDESYRQEIFIGPIEHFSP